MRCKKTKAPVYVNKWKMGHRWIIIVLHYNKVSLLLYLTDWIYVWNYFILRWGKKGDFDYRSTQNKIILYSVPKWIIFVHIFYSNSCWFSTFSKILLITHYFQNYGLGSDSDNSSGSLCNTENKSKKKRIINGPSMNHSCPTT